MFINQIFEGLRNTCKVCGQTPCNCTHVAEEKVRLDPKCWSGKKIGNPKTKMKGGVRVNNCVPAESIEEGVDQTKEAGKAIQNLKNLAVMKTTMTMQQLSQAGQESIITNAINAAKTLEQSYMANKQQGNAVFVRALIDEIDNFRRGTPINASFPETDGPSELGELLQGKLGKVNFQQGVAESLSLHDVAWIGNLIPSFIQRVVTAGTRETKETLQLGKILAKWTGTGEITPAEEEFAKEQLIDIAKMLTSFAIASVPLGSSAAHAATGVASHVSHLASHGAKDLGLEALAVVLSKNFKFDFLKKIVHNLETTTGKAISDVEKKKSQAPQDEIDKTVNQQFQRAKMGFGGMSEMDSQGYTGSRDRKRTSKYGSRDDYELGGPERTGKPMTAKKMMDKAHKAMMKSMSNAEKVDKGWRNPNVDECVEEGWKEKLGAAALTGAMALGAAGAHARVTGDEDPNVNRLTGKPNVTQQATDTAPTSVEAPKGFSKEYLQKASDPNRVGRYLISVEKAQELLSNMKEGAEHDPKDHEADYGKEYQDTVKRAGHAVKNIEKKFGPVDISSLAKRLNDIEQGKK